MGNSRRIRLGSGRSIGVSIGLVSACLVLGLAREVFCEAPSTARPDAQASQPVRFETLTVSASVFTPQAQGYGRVLDPLPIVDAVAAFEAARAAETTHSAELARVQALARDQENASLREFEAARALAARARADLAMARVRVVGAVGNLLARDPDLPALAGRLAEREVSLVRVDIPGNEPIPIPELGISLETHPASAHALGVRFVGFAPAVDPALSGWGLLVLVTSDMPPAPGSIVVAQVATRASSSGFRVPASALVLQADHRFVFVDDGSGAFERRAVESSLLEDGSQFVSKGLVTGERVVVTGAQQLLSKETLGDAAGAGE